MGLERWLRSAENLLLMQKTEVSSQYHTGQPTTAYNTGSKGSNALLLTSKDTCMHVVYIYRHTHL